MSAKEAPATVEMKLEVRERRVSPPSVRTRLILRLPIESRHARTLLASRDQNDRRRRLVTVLGRMRALYAPLDADFLGRWGKPIGFHVDDQRLRATALNVDYLRVGYRWYGAWAIDVAGGQAHVRALVRPRQSHHRLWATLDAPGFSIGRIEPPPHDADGTALIRWRSGTGDQTQAYRATIELDRPTQAKLTEAWLYLRTLDVALTCALPLLLLLVALRGAPADQRVGAVRRSARAALAIVALWTIADLVDALEMNLAGGLSWPAPQLITTSVIAVTGLGAVVLALTVAARSLGRPVGRSIWAAVGVGGVCLGVVALNTVLLSATDPPPIVDRPGWIVMAAVAATIATFVLGSAYAWALGSALAASWPTGRSWLLEHRHSAWIIACVVGGVVSFHLLNWGYRWAWIGVDSGVAEGFAYLWTTLTGSYAESRVISFAASWLAILPIVVLLAAIAAQREHSGSALLAPRGAVAILGLAFAALTTGPQVHYWGLAPPLATLVVLIVLWLLLRQSDARVARTLRRIADANGIPRDETPDIVSHRVELLERAVELDRVERRDAALYAKYLADDDHTIQAYRRGREDLASRRKLLAEGSAASDDGLRLPPEFPPKAAALVAGPGDGWWDNATIAARDGARLAVIPVGIYAYYAIGLRIDAYTGYEYPFASLSAVSGLLREAATWLIAAFVLGALYTRLPGRNGVIKGGTLAAVFFVGQLLTAGVLTSSGDDGWTFRSLEMLIFLTAVGLVVDVRTAREAGMGWRQVGTLYGALGLRPGVAYASTAFAAGIAFVQQLLSGAGSEAVNDLLRSVPTLFQP